MIEIALGILNVFEQIQHIKLITAVLLTNILIRTPIYNVDDVCVDQPLELSV